MATFEKYLNSEGDTENKERQLKIINKIILSDESVQKIKNIKKGENYFEYISIHINNICGNTALLYINS